MKISHLNDLSGFRDMRLLGHNLSVSGVVRHISKCKDPI